jgi:paraquat-inducible protein A
MVSPAGEPMSGRSVTARAAGLLACETCGLLSHSRTHAPHPVCERCGAALHERKPNSIQRTWALLIAACVLYVPANLLPVMVTGSFLGTEEDTIMSGVVYLWVSGSWPLALLVFIASITVPLLKLIAIAILLITTQLRLRWAIRQRTKMYRVVEFVGRWSMLDVFVVAILAGLVQIQSLATVQAGAGAVAFGSVVVLTMIAALCFDPRLMWDAMERDDG